MARKKKVVEQEPTKPSIFVIYHLQQLVDLSWSKRKVKEFDDFKEMYKELQTLNHDELKTDFYSFEIE